MFAMSQLLRNKANYVTSINVDVTILREAARAYLISFDGRQEWLPKSWILSYKHSQSRKIRIIISAANWTRKFE